MSDQDGLFENPEQNEEQNIEEQKRDALLGIKDDTSSIIDVLNTFGGRQIDLLAQAEKHVKAIALSDRRNNEALIRTLKTSKVVEPAVENKQEKAQSGNKEESPRSAYGTNNKIREIAHKITHQPADGETQSPISKQSEPARNDVQKKSSTKNENDDNRTNSENLPNGWRRDKDRRVRDQRGRYVKNDELAKHGIKTPDSKNSEAETAELARENALLDALKDVKDAVQSPDNLDPLIDGVKELAGPLGAAFDIGKTVVGTSERGFSKLEGIGNKEQHGRDRFFNFFKKSTKKQEKSNEHQVGWLKRIWKKPTGTSFFGRLFGLLSGLVQLPLLLARLPFLLVSGLGKLLLGGLGAIFRGGKGIVGGIGKLGAGLFSGIGKLGKGFLKKIPILGALFALSDGVGGLFDNTRDENGKSNRGKRVGSAVGTAAGALIGSVVGPIGTITGAMIGDWLGEKIGAWAADFDWANITNKISSAWDASVEWIKSSWNSIDWSGFTSKVSSAWDAVSSWVKSSWDNIDWGTFGEKVSQIWNGVSSWIKEIWGDIDFSGAWETTKNVAGKIKDGGIALAGKAFEGAKNVGRSVGSWVSEKASSAADTVSGWFGYRSNDISSDAPSETLDNIEEAEKTQIINNADSYSVLEKIKNILADSLLLWREWVAHFYENEANVDAVSNGHPLMFGSSTSTQGSLSDTSGVSMITGTAVDPKTGKPLRYTDAEFKGGKIDGLNEEETALAMNALSARESSGDFQAENQFGYIGGYQFGAEALADLGYVNKQKWQRFQATTKGKNIYAGGKGNSLHAQFLNDPSNWNLAGGKQTYLNSKKMQDESAVKLMNKNIRFLKSKGIKLDSAEDIVGAGFASHLKGAGNALKLYKNGVDSRDANGTSTSYYAQLGRNAVMDKKALYASSVKIATSTQGLTIPKADRIAGMSIPAITPPKDTTQETIRRVEQESAKKSTVLQQPPRTQTQNASVALDPALQFLTQDVSDRRIAHIVTGGIAQKGRI